MYNDELQHFGIKGMKWGVRKAANKMKENAATRKSYRTDKGPKRYGFINAANSAARTYYRKERTKNFQAYRKAESKLELKTARLTDEQVRNGRYRVARARNIKRKTLSVALGTAAGAALVASGAAAVGVPVGAAVAVAANYKTGAHYYAKQSSAYGSTRARYANQDRVKNRRDGYGVTVQF